MQNSEPHQIVRHHTPTALTGDEDFCPICRSNWKTKPIPEQHRHFYGDKTHFSDLIGIEVQGFYDGVAIWECQSCKTQFPRAGISKIDARGNLLRDRR
jgi:hypothetical protein